MYAEVLGRLVVTDLHLARPIITCMGVEARDSVKIQCPDNVLRKERPFHLKRCDYNGPEEIVLSIAIRNF